MATLQAKHAGKWKPAQSYKVRHAGEWLEARVVWTRKDGRWIKAYDREAGLDKPVGGGLAAPAELRGNANEWDRVKLTWDAVPGADSYRITWAGVSKEWDGLKAMPTHRGTKTVPGTSADLMKNSEITAVNWNQAYLISVRALKGETPSDPTPQPFIWKNGEASWVPESKDFEGVVDVM